MGELKYHELYNLEDKDSRYGNIPDRTLEALRRWVEQGTLPGHFLQAVLKGKLYDAVSRADSENREALTDLTTLIRSRAPTGCYGSPEHVEQWEGLASVADQTDDVDHYHIP